MENNKVVVISADDFVLSIYDEEFKITITNKHKSNQDIATEVQKVIDELTLYNAGLFNDLLEEDFGKN
jgi:hypothetical protein